jgi:hypothetical protein
MGGWKENVMDDTKRVLIAFICHSHIIQAFALKLQRLCGEDEAVSIELILVGIFGMRKYGTTSWSTVRLLRPFDRKGYIWFEGWG